MSSLASRGSSSVLINRTCPLTLSRISQSDVISEYMRGMFNVPLNKLSARAIIKVEESIDALLPPSGKNEAEDREYHVDTDGKRVETIFTQTAMCRSFDSGNSMPGGRCFYCTRDCEDGQYVGCPIHISEWSECIERAANPRYASAVVFWVEGIYCDYDCVYSALCHNKDDATKNKVSLLAKLTSQPSPKYKDMRLLQCNGGPLTDKQWDRNANNYQMHNAVICMPVKRKYFTVQ